MKDATTSVFFVIDGRVAVGTQRMDNHTLGVDSVHLFVIKSLPQVGKIRTMAELCEFEGSA